jgi:hypothetical protein
MANQILYNDIPISRLKPLTQKGLWIHVSKWHVSLLLVHLPVKTTSFSGPVKDVLLKNSTVHNELTILSLRGIWESSFRSSTGSSNSPFMKRSSFTLAPLALIRRKTCLRRDANVSLLCVKISRSSTALPGFENRTSSARCFPLQALQ